LKPPSQQSSSINRMLIVIFDAFVWILAFTTID
jgi:hypothetical protein